MRNINDELVVACVKIGQEFSDRWIFQHQENGDCVTINKILSNKNGHSIVVAQVLGNDSDYGGAKDFGGDRVTKVGKVYKDDQNKTALNILAFFRHKVTIILVILQHFLKWLKKKLVKTKTN